MSEQPNIYKIYKITAKLKLNSPLLIADGENDGVIDKHILKNKKGEPFIPGTSLAGALRNLAIRKNKEIAELLFGKSENNDNDSQSAIMINDIILKNYSLVLRDGVKIDPYTQSAINGAKYDYEAIEKALQTKEGKKELKKFVEVTPITISTPAKIKVNTKRTSVNNTEIEANETDEILIIEEQIENYQSQKLVA